MKHLDYRLTRLRNRWSGGKAVSCVVGDLIGISRKGWSELISSTMAPMERRLQIKIEWR